MENKKESLASRLLGSSLGCMRKFIFRLLSVGPIPIHMAFILDGNRRYAKKWNLGEGMGHRAGFLALMSMLKYCYELGVRYVTVYAFSIDNFKRRSEEVQFVMDLMLEKIEGFIKEESVVNQHGVRVYFIGNLSLLNDTVRQAAERAMEATSKNDRTILLICVAYSSTDEIVHAAQECCESKLDVIQSSEKQEVTGVINLVDIERNMYMGLVPDPDVLVRSSGETRLSNFLLWQTSNCLLFSPKALWPEFGLPHLVWAILNFQGVYFDLEKKRKQL